MKFKLLVAAAALALSASASFAQDAPIPLVLTPSGAGMFTATFQRTVTGLFIDTFSFTPASFSGNVAVSLTPLDGSINFFSALLNGEGFSFFPEDGHVKFEFQSAVNSGMPLELQVFGFAGDAETLTDMTSTYRGTITATAVGAIPEPQTYGLMLAGLALMAAIGRSAKRRVRA